MSAIHREAWLAALATVEPVTDAEAFTITELMATFGLKETATKERVRKLVETGAAILTRKRITDALGRTQTVAAYRLVTGKGGTHGANHKRTRPRRHP